MQTGILKLLPAGLINVFLCLENFIFYQKMDNFTYHDYQFAKLIQPTDISSRSKNFKEVDKFEGGTKEEEEL